MVCRVQKRDWLCPQSMFEAAVRVRACRFLEAVLLEMRFQIVTVCMKAVFGQDRKSADVDSNFKCTLG